MRFHTIVASAIAAIAAVSAQSSEDPSVACISCLSNNMLTISACKNIDTSEIDYTSSDTAVRTCLCTMAGDLSWVNSCVGNNVCTGSYINTWKAGYGDIYKNYCSDFSINSKSAAWKLTAPKAGAALLVTVAAALV
ncbi:hypothetical protein BGX20_011469 [Mortierella sp. AD010]|nr:hypothetical protein BGX20_011469 [Mortierella sp. AD010]